MADTTFCDNYSIFTRDVDLDLAEIRGDEMDVKCIT